MAIGKQKKNIKKNKGATRNRRSEKKSNNGQKKKNKKASNDLQNTPQKTRLSNMNHTNMGVLACSGRVSVFCSTSGACRVIVGKT